MLLTGLIPQAIIWIDGVWAASVDEGLPPISDMWQIKSTWPYFDGLLVTNSWKKKGFMWKKGGFERERKNLMNEDEDWERSWSNGAYYEHGWNLYRLERSKDRKRARERRFTLRILSILRRVMIFIWFKLINSDDICSFSARNLGKKENQIAAGTAKLNTIDKYSNIRWW